MHPVSIALTILSIGGGVSFAAYSFFSNRRTLLVTDLSQSTLNNGVSTPVTPPTPTWQEFVMRAENGIDPMA